MPIRNRWMVGDYLMLDDESGLVHPRSQMVKLWDGTWRHKRNFETRQPQEFVQARNDPKALLHIRPDDVAQQPSNVISATVGGSATTVPAPTGPASHLFDPAIGEMKVGFTYVVR